LDRCQILRDSTAQKKGMPRDFQPKELKLDRGNVRVRARGGSTALVWKGRRVVYMLRNMHPLPAEGNFCDENNRPVKPHIVEWYNQHMGYIDSSDRMATSYSMSRRTLKWTKKLFFHLLDLTVLNSWILSYSCGAKYIHRDFRLLLVRNLIEEAGKNQDRHTPKVGWKTKFGRNKYCVIQEPP